MAAKSSNNLLNLLNYKTNITTSSNASATSSTMQPASVSLHTHATSEQIKVPTPGSSQDALLRLLSVRTPPVAVQQSAAPVTDTAKSPGDAPHPKKRNPIPKSPVWDYVNKYDDLRIPQPDHPPVTSGTSTMKLPLHNQSSPAPSTLPDGRTPLDALMGIAPKHKHRETVSQALQEVGEQANEQAKDALARIQSDTSKALNRKPEEVHSAMQQAAIEIKEEMKDAETKAAFERGMPPAMAQAFEETIDQVANGEEVVDNWETAAGDDSMAFGDQKESKMNDTRVFQFPMLPFVAVRIQPHVQPTARIRDEVIMKVASFKKEFDQIDRTLASATNKHIVYSMVKGGGVRIIRQEDGTNQHVFKKQSNLIFNVAIGAGNDDGPEPVLSTATNGSVFWTDLPGPSDDPDLQTDLNQRGFQFPPLPSQEDNNTSGAQLKTRAKLSNKHPEFFALGRGKSIYIIWPKIAMLPKYCDATTRIVDSVKYFSERSLKIATGKAGKDFAFSQDDSVIASLDKAGRLKFWDIRDHGDPEIAASEVVSRQVEVKVPLMTVLTSALDKSAATSVHFLDKERPYNRGSASRYVLVGSKQNHVLTLWDLALGKPVQELSFPQENDTDPICSIAFYAKMGLIFVGHPKRNSMFVISLSAPKYNLSHMTQASFIDRLAKKDITLPKPESTAIMSSMREISLDGIGALRSLDINSPNAGTPDNSPSKSLDLDQTVLEVYMLHSHGCTCLNLKKQDLGLGADGKPIEPESAKDAGMIVMDELASIVAIEGSEASSEPTSKAKAVPETNEPTKNRTPNAKKEQAASQTFTSPPPIRPVPSKESTKTAASSTTKETPVASASTKRESSAVADEPTVAEPATLVTTTLAGTAKDANYLPHRLELTSNESLLSAEELTSRISGTLGDTISKSIGGVLSSTFGAVLGDQLEKLYKRIDDDKRVQEAAGAAKQDAILRLVASTLTDNVEKSLAIIVGGSIHQQVVPTITTVVAQVVDKNISEALGHQLQATLPREMKTALAPAVVLAMQDREVLRIVSDLVSTKISAHVEEVFAATLKNTIVPSFKKLATESAQRVAGEVDGRVRGQLKDLDVHLTNDGAKLDRLTSLTSELLQTVKTMAGAQGDMQTEILQLRTELAQYQQQAAASASAIHTTVPLASQADPEMDAVAASMSSGNYEEGTMQWLQSPRLTEIFDKVFARLNPSYLSDMNQVVVLSVAAAVSNSFDDNISERLIWLNTAVSSIDTQNADIAEHAYGVLNAITERLQESYMAISEESPADTHLPKISKLVRRLKEVKKMFG